MTICLEINTVFWRRCQLSGCTTLCLIRSKIVSPDRPIRSTKCGQIGPQTPTWRSLRISAYIGIPPTRGASQNCHFVHSCPDWWDPPRKKRYRAMQESRTPHSHPGECTHERTWTRPLGWKHVACHQLASSWMSPWILCCLVCMRNCGDWRKQLLTWNDLQQASRHQPYIV